MRRSGDLQRRSPGSQGNLVSTLPGPERLALVDREAQALPLAVQADLLGISRSSLYYRPRRATAEEVALKHRIDAIYTQHPFYGSRRITAQLRREGEEVNRKAVQRHMREMGIAGICPGPNLSRRARGEQVYPYLLRGLTGVGDRCDLHPSADELDVSGRGARLVLALRRQLGTRRHLALAVRA